MLATIMRRGRTWPWIRMRPFLARFSEPVWLGHLPSSADFITTTLGFFGTHTANWGGLTFANWLLRGLVDLSHLDLRSLGTCKPCALCHRPKPASSSPDRRGT